MFDGVPVEQFHQFISTPSSRISTSSSPSSSSSSLPIPLSLIPTPPISTSTNLNFLSFDPLLFPNPHPHHTHQNLFQSHHHNHLLLQTPTKPYDNHGQQQHTDLDTNPWSNDEVIQLLRIKSSSENWFPDFCTWENVSRKLGDIGYKRSAEKCKEKFEEETCRSFSSTIVYNKNSSRYLISDELDEHLYHTDDLNNQQHVPVESPEKVDQQCCTAEEQVLQEQEQEKEGGDGGGGGDNEIEGQKGNFKGDPSEVMQIQPSQDNEQVVKGEMAKSKKRKRKHRKFEMFKGLCVDVVNKMLSQQEEMHNKLLKDMLNRDEEKIKREEAWRKEEMERVNKEIEIREHETVMARDRQSTITEFINKFNSSDMKIQLSCDTDYEKLLANATKTNKSMKVTTTTTTSESEIPKVSTSRKTTETPNRATRNAKEDTGKRWPRDEVLALINMRSNVYNGVGGNNEEKEGGIGNGNGNSYKGGSLWERISQGMLELGYKRSAKRCKEKWENINKYFRKTKDANKKRSLDSRTCPYFHQLSTLYNQGKLGQAGEMSTD